MTAVATRDAQQALAHNLEQMKPQFQQMLPPDVSVDRFTRVVMTAIQKNPDLMGPDVDKRTLFLSCSEAAADGLLPDGKQGALVMYGKKVQWQRMIGGLRVIASRHGFDLRAEEVYENDQFEYQMGDDPKIVHNPPQFGTDRGKVIGAYAIAKHLESGEVYREVMDIKQLEAVKTVSRAQGGPWSGPFAGEMRRKTVAKRLFKQLPMELDEREQRTIELDDPADFTQPAQDASQPTAAPTAPVRPRGLQTVVDRGKRTAQTTAQTIDQPPASEPPESEDPGPQDPI